jgi:hypothetical protein
MSNVCSPSVSHLPFCQTWSSHRIDDVRLLLVATTIAQRAYLAFLLHLIKSKMIFKRGKNRRLLVLILLSLLLLCSAWEWTDLGGLGGDVSFQTNTLSMEEVRQMRVREIKRRLARSHGYSADELGRMLDKKDLIQALSFEEHKEREKEQQQLKRALLIRGIVVALISVVVVVGWPVWQHLCAVASVNFAVYTDRKRHEAGRCLELKSVDGMFGILLMAIVDILQLWLSASVVR